MSLPDEANTITGGCSCGAIRYRLAVPSIQSRPQHPMSPPSSGVRLPQALTCHCNDCRRATGSSLAVSVIDIPAPMLTVSALSLSFESTIVSGRILDVMADDYDAEKADSNRPPYIPAMDVLRATQESKTWLRFFHSINCGPDWSRSFCGRCGTPVCSIIYVYGEIRPAMAITTILSWVLLASTVHGKIDRHRIVSENNVVRTNLIDNKTTPLQVGNGNFAFSVDTTGMQTYLPFNTMSVWAWHNDTMPKGSINDYTGVPALTHGRNVSYEVPDPALPDVTQWLIGNPNRVNLGRIGLRYNNDTLKADKISNTYQKLDLWNGTITSTFKVDGFNVRIVTQGDFASDAVSFKVESELVQSGDLTVEIDFPYPPIHSTTYKYEVFTGVYDFPTNHTTAIVSGLSKNAAHIRHEMQETKYFINFRWPKKSPLSLERLEPANSGAITAHRYTLSPSGHGSKTTQLSFTAHFSPFKAVPDTPNTIMQQNRGDWNNYWKEGGFIDLTQSSNPNATELQRRIIQSQYHVRVNSAGTGQPPQESGLMNNGWYGKFHMEMVLWHCAHWVSWGREKYFHNTFPAVYESLLPSSMDRAKRMGWSGARWPKMTEILTGQSSPGTINGLLLWQQPHPMYMAKLAYKTQPTKRTLQRWDPILEASADYMASYAWYNESSGYYDLGPPAYGVTENTPPTRTLNLAYEIAYWRYGLDVACEWKKRLGRPIPDSWTDVASRLAKPPQIDGLYAVYEGLNASWWEDPALIGDPRSLNMLKGFLPNTPAVDEEVAQLTADKIWDIWPDAKIRGWGRPILAINSARIGNPERAIHHLTAYDYWKFDDAGFAIRGGDGGTPPPFMPGNAGLLLAVAYMAEGWDGSSSDAPGFPNNGEWVVKKENLRQAL